MVESVMELSQVCSSDLWGEPLNGDDGEVVFVKVNFLGTTGGKDIADTTRRILRQIMVTSVACRLNYLGRGKKMGIADMKLLQLVVGESL
jgi:hypothetical protein